VAKEFKTKFESPFSNTALPACLKNIPQYLEISHKAKWLKNFDPIYLQNSFTSVLLRRPKTANLVVLIPGIFADYQSNTTRRLASLLYKAGNHVLVFSNPMSTRSLRSRPNFHPLSPFKESMVIYRAITKTLNKLNNVKSINILGSSYGAFLSAIISNINMHSPSPLNISKYTLISPPYNLKESLRNIDRLISLSLSTDSMNRYLMLLKLYAKLCDIERVLPSDEKGFKKLIGYFAFYLKLKRLLKETIPGKRKSIAFIDYLKIYNGGVFTWISTERGNIDFWINRARREGFTSFRILSSDDDIINTIGVWDDREDVLLLRGGGHNGILYYRWFEDFIDLVFK
jgi:hypothetical protein